jgi:AraC-like DNA-binding protein
MAKTEKKNLWLLSEHRGLYEKVRMYYPKHAIIKKPDNKNSPNPDLFVLGCDYKCRLEECLEKFKMLALFPTVPHIIARSFLVGRSSLFINDFLWSEFYESSNGNKPKNIFLSQIPIDHPNFYFISVQVEIVENCGKNIFLSEIIQKSGYSNRAFRSKLKVMTGFSILTITRKIRLCHALWALIVLKKSVKVVAYESGYHPFSFSRSFSRMFGIPPSNV